MGNCQAIEVAAAVVQHPDDGKVERFYCPMIAHDIMAANPGHYVALVAVASPYPNRDSLETVTPRQQQLKLLRPDDSLLVGHVYCLISFEDVLKEFAAKKSGKLQKMEKQPDSLGQEYDHTRKINKKDSSRSDPNMKLRSLSSLQPRETDVPRASASSSSSRTNEIGGSHLGSNLQGGWRQYNRASAGGQWRPALQSISEIGT